MIEVVDQGLLGESKEPWRRSAFGQVLVVATEVAVPTGHSVVPAFDVVRCSSSREWSRFGAPAKGVAGAVLEVIVSVLPVGMHDPVGRKTGGADGSGGAGGGVRLHVTRLN